MHGLCFKFPTYASAKIVWSIFAIEDKHPNVTHVTKFFLCLYIVLKNSDYKGLTSMLNTHARSLHNGALLLQKLCLINPRINNVVKFLYLPMGFQSHATFQERGKFSILFILDSSFDGIFLGRPIFSFYQVQSFVGNNLIAVHISKFSPF